MRTETEVVPSAADEIAANGTTSVSVAVAAAVIVTRRFAPVRLLGKRLVGGDLGGVSSLSVGAGDGGVGDGGDRRRVRRVCLFVQQLCGLSDADEAMFADL